MKHLLPIAFLAAASMTVLAAPLETVMVNTNGVQVAPAMLTLTNVVIQGFAFEDLDDVDISARSIGDVPTWDGTNLVFTAPGGHDPASVAGGLLTLSGQQIGLSTSTVRTAVNTLERIAGQTIAPTVILPASLQLELSSPEGTGILMTPDADSGIGVVEVSGSLTASGNLDGVNVTATGLISGDGSGITNTVEVLRGSQWTGPRSSEKPGWFIKSFDIAGQTKLLARGFQDFSGTQYTATADSEFVTPTDSTAFRDAGAVAITLLADSTTSSICSFRVYVFKNATQVYDSGASQVVASTSAKHIISIPASSLGTFTAGASYTVRVEASVKYDSGEAKGIYFVGTPTIQVIK